MRRKLEEMSLEELWELFPVFLTAPDERWRSWYEEEAARVLAALPEGTAERISHIGSTAIPGIRAKNIVDILLEVRDRETLRLAADALASRGWIRMSGARGRVSLNKGYTPEGFAERVFHLHLRLEGDNDELYFRDYLIERPEVAKSYEELKLRLWKRFERDRDAYTEGKTEFVRACSRLAREAYDGRYEARSRAAAGERAGAPSEKDDPGS